MDATKDFEANNHQEALIEYFYDSLIYGEPYFMVSHHTGIMGICLCVQPNQFYEHYRGWSQDGCLAYRFGTHLYNIDNSIVGVDSSREGKGRII